MHSIEIETYNGQRLQHYNTILLVLIWEKELEYNITFVRRLHKKNTEAHIAISPFKNRANTTKIKLERKARVCIYILQMLKKNK